MNERDRRRSSPLAAGGAVLAVLGLLGLAQGYSPRPATTHGPRLDGGSLAHASTADAGMNAPQVQRLLERRPMDVNRASGAELELLPGIGPTLAERIVMERERGGPFSSMSDLERVRGIGARTIEKLRSLATVEGFDAGAGSVDSIP